MILHKIKDTRANVTITATAAVNFATSGVCRCWLQVLKPNSIVTLH